MYHQSITLIGRTTGNVKVKKTSDQTLVANFTIAINRRNQPTVADFIPSVIWGDKAKEFSGKFGKGSLVLLEGELRTTSIPQEEGKPKNEIQFEVKYFKQMETPKAIEDRAEKEL